MLFMFFFVVLLAALLAIRSYLTKWTLDEGSDRGFGFLARMAFEDNGSVRSQVLGSGEPFKTLILVKNGFRWGL